MKKRCIDSAFKVIKVPKRPGQLVNEGRRKKGMMENHTATHDKPWAKAIPVHSRGVGRHGTCKIGATCNK